MLIHDQIPMLKALYAEGPASAPQMMLYGQFVGSWERHLVDHLSNGNRREAQCEVHFGWVLEGRAVQDVWIVPPRNARKNPEASPYNLYGTTLRVYDPHNDFWHITWLNPVTQTFSSMIGRKVGDDIVQEYQAEDGKLCQWVFTEITTTSFHWIRRQSSDGGATWRVEREFFLRRSAPDSLR